MKKTILTLSTVVALGLSLSTASLAFAADDVSCVEATKVVDVRADAAAAAAVNLADNAPELSDEVQEQADGIVAKIAELRPQLDEALAALDAAPSLENALAAQDLGAQLSGLYNDLTGLPGVPELGSLVQAVIDARAALEVALGAQTTACEDVDEPDPTPTETPDPTTPPPAQEPENVFNCIDFPLEDGTTAQAMLDSDTTDPHNLDTDGDGVACEADQPDATPDTDDDDTVDSGTVVVPNGGVNTGGGPAWAFTSA